MKKNTLVHVIDEVQDILRCMKYAAERDVDFPLDFDFAEAERAKYLIIQLPGLILRKPTEAITGAAHCANTVLGDVCPHCRKPVRPVIYRAATSETGDVGQNLGQLKDGDKPDG